MTAAVHPPVPVFGDLAAARHWYRTRLGWETFVSGGELRMPLTGSTVGFRVPPALAARVLPSFAAAGAPAPAVAVGRPGGAVVLLADANDRWWSQAEMPEGVLFLRAPAAVPLPPGTTAGSPVTWANPPDPAQPYLPIAEGVLQVVRTVLGLVDPRPRVRAGRTRSPWSVSHRIPHTRP